MQAHHMLQRLLSAPLNQNVLKHYLERPLRRSASTQTSARNSETLRATSSLPHTSTNEQNQYTDDGSTTFRNRTSDSSSKRRPLPLPPLMDPIALSARERWTEPKKPAPTKKEDLTPFQRKLYTNPYAHALATPIRADRSTATHQPNFHLVSLHAHAHPTTSIPHLVPTHLALAAQPSASSKNKPVLSSLPPAAYTLLRLPHIRHLTRTRNDRWRSALNLRLEGRLPAHSTSSKDLYWRPDMPTHILALLRATAFRRLQWCFARSGGGGMLMRLPAQPEAPSPSSESEITLSSRLSAILDAGALLFLTRTTRRETREAQARVRAALDAGDAAVDVMVRIRDASRRALKEAVLPRAWGSWDTGGPRLHPGVLYSSLEYPSIRYQQRLGEGDEGRQEEVVGREIPVYDLAELLGEERLGELLEGSTWKGEVAVVLREKETTIGAHHALMQLQDYVIESV